MRRFASFLLFGLALAGSAAATEIWRWKDASGVVHYSDSPVPGAERLNVKPASSGDADSGVSPPDTSSSSPASSEQGAATAFRYTRCEVAQPTNDQVFFSVDQVDASFIIEPALQPGHSIQLYVNGARYPDWPARQFSGAIANLYRGSYSVSVRVVDAQGRAQCTGPSITFHVRQPSVLAPNRKPAGK